MAKVPGLSRRGSVWQFRVRVPEKLKAAIGKGEIVKSLGAVTHAEAARLARIERIEADRRFAEAEVALRTGPVEELSTSKLRHLARTFFFRLERETTEPPFDPELRSELADQTARDLAAISDWSDQQSVQQVAIKFANWANVNVKLGSKAFFDLCGAVQAAHIEHYGREHDRLSGRPERRIEERFRDIDKHHPPKSRLTIAEAAKRYIEDPSRTDNAPKTFAAYRFRLAAWVDLLGPDRPAADIGRDEIRDALEVLLRLPANAVRKHPDTSLRKIAAAGVADGQRKLNAASIEIYLRYLRSLFQYLVTEQVRADNPAAGIRGPKPPREKPRRPWTVDELNQFFHRPPFDRPWNGGRAGSPLYWMPLIALFSGAREGELAALRREDVFQQDGIWLIRLVDTEERRLKTVQSARTFPVHPALVTAGFLEFLRTVPEGGPLFVDIPATKLGAAHWCQKQIGRHVRKVFSDPKVVFHSLRHNFRDAAREANLPLEVVGAIGGWKDGTQTAMAGYGAGPSAKNLAEWMAKIDYPDVKLDHLTPLTPSATPVRYRKRPQRT